MITERINPNYWTNHKYNGNGSYSATSHYINYAVKIRGEIQSVTFDGTWSILAHTWNSTLQKWEETVHTDQIYPSCYIETFGYTRRATASTSDGATTNINYCDASRIIIDLYYVNTGLFSVHPPDWEPPTGSTDTYYTLNEYPAITYTAYVWEMIDGEPRIEDMPDEAEYTEPIPLSQWTIKERYNDGFPFNGLLRDIPYSKGAFEDAASLASVRVPISVKTIGPTAFAGTALRRVKIAADCTYEETSFPEACVIERYPDDRYGQLYDSAGKAVLDYDARRVYVLKEDINNG